MAPPQLARKVPPLKDLNVVNGHECCGDHITPAERMPSAIRRRVEEASHREFTLEEVSRHNSADDCWIIVSGKVYNVSSWLKHHPGGELPIVRLAGKDATEPFLAFHPHEVLQSKLPVFQVGVLKGWQPSPLHIDMCEIRRDMEKSGLFRTSKLFLFGKVAWQTVLLVLAVWLITLGPNTIFGWWMYMISACVLGLFWQQMAFLGHDFGHNSISHNRDLDYWGSIIVSILFGVSGQWWKRNHNIHHIVTNAIEHDPDIQHLPVFAVTDKMFNGFFSTYYQKMMTMDHVARFLVSYQHVLFYPVMAVARLNLYVQSFLIILARAPVRRRFVELSSLLGFWAWYLWLLFLLPDVSTALLYASVAHAICGIIHLQITLSHFAMPTYHGEGYVHNDPDHFFRTQLLTSLNIECPRWFDWFHGGLQFQVEHHVFPRVSRQHLRLVGEKYLRPLAKKYGYTVESCGFYEANRRVFNTLRASAYTARALPAGAVPAGDSCLTKLLNADG